MRRFAQPEAAQSRRITATLWVAFFLLGTGIQYARAEQTTHVVTIDGMRFEPETLVVQQGDRIIWKNRDLVAHTATSKAFYSGAIAPSKSWTYVAKTVGTYEYICTLHPAMKAVLVVKGK